MTNDRTLALQIKDLLTVCLAKSIDKALAERYGAQWFEAFSKEDAKSEKPILYPDQISIYSCDTQALFKILRHREHYTHEVLTCFGFLRGDSAPDTAAKKKQFSRLMERLITDFRNSMEAHIPAYAIEGETDGALYTYADAITDMLKLAVIFRATVDENGLSYYDHMTALLQNHSDKQNLTVCPVADVLTALRAGVTSSQLVDCCAQLHIPVNTVDGVLCISSADYTADLSRIRAFFAEAEASHFQKSKRILIAALSAVVILMITVGIVVWVTGQPPAPEENYYRNTNPVSVVEEQISLVPTHVYWEKDVLVAECAIVNGYNTAVSNITVTDFTIKSGDSIIAKQTFGVIGNGNAVQSRTSVKWTFRFDKSSISIPGADLTDPGKLNFHISIPQNLILFH